MMDIMKLYKSILVIELKDWTILYSEKSRIELRKYLEKCKDIVDIDWVLFNKYEFKKAYEQSIEWTDSYILTFSKDIQDKLKQREKEKRNAVWRWFDSIEEIENRLISKNLILKD